MKNHIFLLYLVCACIPVGCTCTNSGSSSDEDRGKYLPSVTGAPGEVFVIADKDYWDGDIGTSVRNRLTEDYPFLPQSEQTFSVFNSPHSSFNGSFCLHRNILLINVGGGKDSACVTYQMDVWAHPQIVITATAPNQDAMLELIDLEKDRIAMAFEQKERDRIITNTRKFEDREIRKVVSSFLGGAPYFTRDFSIKKKTDSFIWISHETTYVNQGTFFFKIPYRRLDEMTSGWCIPVIDSALQANVPGQRDYSFMITNNYVEPGISYVTFKERSFVEIRGLWELSNDYMGGPFLCQIFPDPSQNFCIVEYGFVYAPKYEKRNYLRTIESILYSFEWDK